MRANACDLPDGIVFLWEDFALRNATAAAYAHMSRTRVADLRRKLNAKNEPLPNPVLNPAAFP